MTPAQLRALGNLMEARKARDLALLERLVAEDRALLAEIASLVGLGAADAAGDETLPPGRHAARLAWIDGRIAAARRRRSSLAPEIDRARTTAVQSLGRAQALDHLAASADRVEATRRVARDQPQTYPLTEYSTANVPKMPHVNPGRTRTPWP